MSNQIKQDVKRQAKGKKSGFFSKLLRAVFLEDWGLKILAIAFAAAVWIIFKASQP